MKALIVALTVLGVTVGRGLRQDLLHELPTIWRPNPLHHNLLLTFEGARSGMVGAPLSGTTSVFWEATI